MTQEITTPRRPFWGDRARALAESVLVFAIIAVTLAMFVAVPPWVYVLVWFATCILWPSKPVLWKNPSRRHE